MDLNTVDWSRVCGAVAYSGGVQVCTLAPHGEDSEHFWTPAERVPDALAPCQASKMINGVLHLCALYGQHVNRDHEWVRPSEMRPGQINRARPNPTGPEPSVVRRPTERDPLCLHPNPNGDGTLCALPPDHAISGHGHYYVRLGGPGPGAKPVEPGNGNSGDPPESGPVGSPPTRPDGEYTSTRERGPEPTTPTSSGGSMASVAEVKAAIDAALQQVSEAQAIVRAAVEKVGEAQQSMAAAMEGSGHDTVTSAHAALQQAATELDDFFGATQNAVELAQAYAAAL